jgi:hypothetical protein
VHELFQVIHVVVLSVCNFVVKSIGPVDASRSHLIVAIHVVVLSVCMFVVKSIAVCVLSTQCVC